MVCFPPWCDIFSPNQFAVTFFFAKTFPTRELFKNLSSSAASTLPWKMLDIKLCGGDNLKRPSLFKLVIYFIVPYFIQNE